MSFPKLGASVGFIILGFFLGATLEHNTDPKAGYIKIASADDGKPAPVATEEPKKETAKNGWRAANDWDGQGTKPADYDGFTPFGIDRYEVLPEEHIFKKFLHDLPRGTGAYVRHDALRIDATGHGWLRTDAEVCDQPFPPYELWVTHWDGGYYVHPTTNLLRRGVGTYKTEDGYLPVKSFCWCDNACAYIIHGDFHFLLPGSKPEEPIHVVVPKKEMEKDSKPGK